MAQIRKHLLAFAVAVIIASDGVPAMAQRFRTDDPIRREPAPTDIGAVSGRTIHALFDFVANSAKAERSPSTGAKNVNTVGEVPDSEWFTNRHGVRRMSREELQRGPGNSNAPVPPFIVTGGKTEGITPGFRMRDAKGRLYFVKADPVGNPEMATAADVISSKIFFALGYNTPENYVVRVRRDDLGVSKDARVETPSGRKRKMSQEDLDDILDRLPQRNGSLRVMASLAVDGEPVGPFRYEGTRPDDPNDTVPHEDRRELRGLFVFAAWLNHTDSKAGNTLDVVVSQDGRRFIKHYLVDFGATLGSDSDSPKNARFGREFIVPKGRSVLGRIASFGLYVSDWERASTPDLPAVGRFESRTFKPDLWRSNYPNPAFARRLPADEFWAAKQLLAFTDDDIRALVETGEYSDPRAADYVTRVLVERRDTIVRTYLTRSAPLDGFRVRDGELQFDSLIDRDLWDPRDLKITWFRFDNFTETFDRIPGDHTPALPEAVTGASAGDYFVARIDPSDDEERSIAVYLRRQSNGAFDVVGVDRTFSSGPVGTRGKSASLSTRDLFPTVSDKPTGSLFGDPAYRGYLER